MTRSRVKYPFLFPAKSETQCLLKPLSPLIYLFTIGTPQQNPKLCFWWIKHDQQNTFETKCIVTAQEDVRSPGRRLAVERSGQQSSSNKDHKVTRLCFNRWSFSHHLHNRNALTLFSPYIIAIDCLRRTWEGLRTNKNVGYGNEWCHGESPAICGKRELTATNGWDARAHGKEWAIWKAEYRELRSDSMTSN